mmetsp:Transcript_93304/g.301840  ORF Transcript_93304/g.301840 Transcript_93304/m.301840 type:complete len:337 (+) Transcript_93304:84-1094(+)
MVLRAMLPLLLLQPLLLQQPRETRAGFDTTSARVVTSLVKLLFALVALRGVVSGFSAETLFAAGPRSEAVRCACKPAALAVMTGYMDAGQHPRLVLAAAMKHDAGWKTLKCLQPGRLADFANWLLPGQLVAGRYPFVDPVYCRSHQQGEEQLRLLLGPAGVTTFVCLQEELPEQEDAVAWPSVGIPADGFLGGTFQPYATVAKALAVNYGNSGVKFLRAPMPDLGIPPEGLLERLIPELERRLNAGEVLYLHCWGGRGRTGILAACLLGSRFPDLSPEACLCAVQAGFSARGSPLDRGVLSRSPQTAEQRSFVHEWLARRRPAATETLQRWLERCS